MNTLITGGGGLLGQYLNTELSGDYNILTLYHKNIGNCKEFKNSQAEIINKQVIERLFMEFKPDIVLHNAAVSNPQMAYKMNPGDVYEINVKATKNIAELCYKYKSKLVYTSTDLVYAGYRGSMLKENAKLIPVSLYSETKLMGEIKIQETFDNYIILRVALLIGFGLNHSRNHFQEMYENLKNNKRVKLFYDQYRTPISLREVSRVIHQLLNTDIKGEIINVGGRERVSRFSLGEMLCDIAGFHKSLIDKISMDEIWESIPSGKDIPMVADVSMNTDKLQSYGVKLKSIEELIKEILQN